MEHRASGRYLLSIHSVWTSVEGSQVVVPVGWESVCIYFVAPSGGEAAAVANCRPPGEGPRISSRVTCVCRQPDEQAQASTLVVAAVMASMQAREHLAVQLLCCCQLAERILLAAASVSAHLFSLSCTLACSICKARSFLFPRAVLKSSDKLVTYRVQLFFCYSFQVVISYRKLLFVDLFFFCYDLCPHRSCSVYVAAFTLAA